ncbi:MAG: aryl-sulfate sulfotransferase N-terminal domain-containing protein, partial [Rhodospirillales bacterium]|nr:aryl-sulfate sulfotransferase N-terminal domain-containing protein [Rhodospirillales bacterium]
MAAFTIQPTVEQNPNPRAPLVALVRFGMDEPVSTILEIDDGRKTRCVTFGLDHPPEEGLPVIGLRADTAHRITLTAGTVDPVELIYHTPALPADDVEMPTFTTITSQPVNMADGYTILSIRRGAPTRAI